MVALDQLCSHLDSLLQPSGFSDHCPNGLQVEGKREIQTIATGVTANLETIEAAVQAKADLLLVHHGLFWERDPLVLRGSKKDKVHLLLQHGISLLAYHLPLDAHRDYGNNWRAALELGWRDLTPFGLYKGVPIGVRGRISPTSSRELQQQLEAYYKHPATTALGGPEQIESVALISGGAYRELADAAAAHVDAYVTGSFDEPSWYTAFEEGIHFYALGHSATERIGVQALGQHLQGTFGVRHQFLDIPNPF